ncbi:MAG TPA: HIT family protein [Anaerolineae bacterium]|nr:HIT family protein [Anaerolineae bacterium]
MPPRTESDEKYILDLVAEVLAEPDFRWQHRFPTLLGDPGKDGQRSPLPVDGFFPRHRLIVEYWEKQHSAPVPIMDEGLTVSGVSRGHQRRLYDSRRQAWAEANNMRFVILDYRGFETDPQGRLERDPVRDRQIVADTLRAAGVFAEPDRRRFDLETYLQEATRGCFICRLIKGDPTLPPHHIIWRNREAIAFLSRFPTVYGYTLVAPIAHREQVTGDFTLNEYLALQRIVYAVAEAVRHSLKPERVYVLALGSQQANTHVHWHLVPCPPGTPLEQQQLTLIDVEKQGILQLSDEEAAALITRLQAHLPAWMQERQV